MSSIYDEKTYWDKAAEDPEVDIKYIADVDADECLEAIIEDRHYGSILDLGCGVGRLGIPIAKRNFTNGVFGVDISSEMLQIAQQRFDENPTTFDGVDQNNFTTKICDGRTIPYEDRCFDYVYCMLVFQHLDPETVQGYIKEVARVLKPDGVFRFQYYEGEYHGQLDHNYTFKEMSDMLSKAAMIVDGCDFDLVHKGWTWITATRRTK